MTAAAIAKAAGLDNDPEPLPPRPARKLGDHVRRRNAGGRVHRRGHDDGDCTVSEKIDSVEYSIDGGWWVVTKGGRRVGPEFDTWTDARTFANSIRGDRANPAKEAPSEVEEPEADKALVGKIVDAFSDDRARSFWERVFVASVRSGREASDALDEANGAVSAWREAPWRNPQRMLAGSEMGGD